MSLPKISVITPSFNQGRFIEQTILSVIGQCYTNIEYFVVDGGSTDETIDIIRKYQKNIAWWVSEPDKGQSDAINKAFLKCTGDIVCWLNSDDVLLPGALHFVAEHLSKLTAPTILFGNSLLFKEGKKMHGWSSDVMRWHQTDLKLLDYIVQPSSFWHKTVIDKVGMLSTSLHFIFDWEWFIRAKEAGIAFTPTSRVLSLYRLHEQHKTSTGGDTRLNEILKIYETYNTANEYKALKRMFGLRRRTKNKLFNAIFRRDYLLYFFFRDLVPYETFKILKHVL